MYGVIRQGTMPVYPKSTLGHAEYGVSSGRFHSLEGMKKRIEGNEADIRLYEKQLKVAKTADEKDQLRKLIQRKKEKNKDLEKAIKLKTERKAERERRLERFKARMGLYSGIGIYTQSPVGKRVGQIELGPDEDYSGVLDSAKDWYSGLSGLHKALVIGAAYAVIGGGVLLYRRRRKSIKRNCSCQNK